jgi:hypothetical protein
MREIVFTGSVPLRPAARVFEAFAKHVGTSAPSYPDGEQMGWVGSTLGPLQSNPQLERLYDVKISDMMTIGNTFYRLKPGVRARDLKLGPFLLGDNAVASYKEFARLKKEGVIPPITRFQMTVAGVAILAGHLHMLPQVSFPIAAAALWAEIKKLLDVAPASELVVQFDLPNETSMEEYERRPWAFNIPYYDSLRTTFKDGVEAFAWLANQIPLDVMLGIHTCSAWHLDPDGGQDNRAIVDISNRYLNALKRPLRYIHIPVHPTQQHVSDYSPFRDLELKPETSLILGVINLSDGLEGAKRRIDAAERAGAFDFGVSFWCGLGMDRDICLHPLAEHATSKNIDKVLELHKQVAAF